MSDLQAAKKCGLQTIYIEREAEESWPVEDVSKAQKEGWVNMWIGPEANASGGGILEVARRHQVSE